MKVIFNQHVSTSVGGNENKIVCCSRNDQAILPSTSIFTLIFNICFSNSTSSLCLKLLFAFVQSHESQIDDDGVSLHVSGSFTWDTWNDNWCYQVLIQAYRPISLKAKHFGFWREEAQFSSCLEFLCSSRLIKGQWCFCPTSQLTGNYVFTIICNVIYKLYEILKNVGKCVLGDL